MRLDLAPLAEAFGEGRTSDAHRLFGEAYERHRADPDVLIDLAGIAEQAGLGDLAIRTALAACRLDDRADRHRQLGDLCRALGRLVEAGDAYRRALARGGEAPALAAIATGTHEVGGLGAVAYALSPGMVRLTPTGAEKRALVSFHRAPLLLGEDHPALGYHSAYLDAREVARLLMQRGYALDVVDTGDDVARPEGTFDLVFGVHDDLLRCRDNARPGARRIQWMTGRHPAVQNAAEQARIAALIARRGGAYAPKRRIERVETELDAIRLADSGILIGNRATLATYPEEWQGKIRLIPVCAGRIRAPKPRERLVPAEREFLWLNSFGAVLKGLDLALEAVLADERLILNIVGHVDQEEDFLGIYREALSGHPRIRRHGYLPTDARTFQAVAERCAAFLLPSASEGMSASAATCLQLGLYPVLSRESGIDLPAGSGRYLETCSIEEIGRAMADVLAMDVGSLATQIAVCQRQALALYSRASTTRRLDGILAELL
ncbi:MAG: glycosyltransferase [Alphaproteobacteria bacterium]|nr:glycosyltransferase [Alphaproteobacteria bacterium]